MVGKAFTVPATAIGIVVAFVELIDMLPEGDPAVAPVNRTYNVVAATDPEIGTIVAVEE